MARSRARDHEKLDDDNVKLVISKLESDTPITKKQACELLNISYNTKRLATLIDNYKAKVETRKKLFAQNRGAAWSPYDLKELVIRYLKDEPISTLSASLYRSPGAIKKKLSQVGVPLRDTDVTYHKPLFLPDGSAKEEYSKGDLVWSARYNCVAEIQDFYQELPDHGNVYCIWIFGKHNQFGYQPWYELGQLEVLSQVGAKPDDFIEEGIY
jgi:hypothetical protein